MSAAEALRLWDVRSRTSAIMGKSLHGVSRLVDRLHLIPADTDVEQFGLTGGCMAGVVLFDGRDSHFIGAVVVER